MKDSLRSTPRDTPRVSGGFPRPSNVTDDQRRSQAYSTYPLTAVNNDEIRPNPYSFRQSKPYDPVVDGSNDKKHDKKHDKKNGKGDKLGGLMARRQAKQKETKKSDKGNRWSDHFVAAVGEFVGTVLFLWFAFAWHITAADQASSVAISGGGNSSTTVIYISIAYGFSLLVCAWAFYRISGGLYNPAVTLGMVITGTLPPLRGLCLFPAQMLGGIVAAALVQIMFPGDIKTVETLLAPGVSIAQGVFIEMFLTFILVFTILMLAGEKSKVTFMAPLGIGLSLFLAELAGVYYTGGSLNPARSFGPCVVSHYWPHYEWIYWVGPFLGALVCSGFFYFIKWFDYENANPGQDSADGDFLSGGEESEEA